MASNTTYRGGIRVIEHTPRLVVDEHAPVVQAVNLLLTQALRERASDVHSNRRSTPSGSASASTACCGRSRPSPKPWPTP